MDNIEFIDSSVDTSTKAIVSPFINFKNLQYYDSLIKDFILHNSNIERLTNLEIFTDELKKFISDSYITYDIGIDTSVYLTINEVEYKSHKAAFVKVNTVNLIDASSGQRGVAKVEDLWNLYTAHVNLLADVNDLHSEVNDIKADVSTLHTDVSTLEDNIDFMDKVVAKAVAQLRDDMTSNELVVSAAINAIFPSFPSGSQKYKLVCQNGSTFWESV